MTENLQKNNYISDFLNKFDQKLHNKITKYLSIIAIDFLTKYQDIELSYDHVRSIAKKIWNSQKISQQQNLLDELDHLKQQVTTLEQQVHQKQSSNKKQPQKICSTTNNNFTQQSIKPFFKNTPSPPKTYQTIHHNPFQFLPPSPSPSQQATISKNQKNQSLQVQKILKQSYSQKENLRTAPDLRKKRNILNNSAHTTPLKVQNNNNNVDMNECKSHKSLLREKKDQLTPKVTESPAPKLDKHQSRFDTSPPCMNSQVRSHYSSVERRQLNDDKIKEIMFEPDQVQNKTSNNNNTLQQQYQQSSQNDQNEQFQFSPPIQKLGFQEISSQKYNKFTQSKDVSFRQMTDRNSSSKKQLNFSNSGSKLQEQNQFSNNNQNYFSYQQNQNYDTLPGFQLQQQEQQYQQLQQSQEQQQKQYDLFQSHQQPIFKNSSNEYPKFTEDQSFQFNSQSSQPKRYRKQSDGLIDEINKNKQKQQQQLPCHKKKTLKKSTQNEKQQPKYLKNVQSKIKSQIDHHKQLSKENNNRSKRNSLPKFEFRQSQQDLQIQYQNYQQHLYEQQQQNHNYQQYIHHQFQNYFKDQDHQDHFPQDSEQQQQQQQQQQSLQQQQQLQSQQDFMPSQRWQNYNSHSDIESLRSSMLQQDVIDPRFMLSTGSQFYIPNNNTQNLQSNSSQQQQQHSQFQRLNSIQEADQIESQQSPVQISQQQQQQQQQQQFQYTKQISSAKKWISSDSSSGFEIPIMSHYQDSIKSQNQKQGDDYSSSYEFVPQQQKLNSGQNFFKIPTQQSNSNPNSIQQRQPAGNIPYNENFQFTEEAQPIEYHSQRNLGPHITQTQTQRAYLHRPHQSYKSDYNAFQDTPLHNDPNLQKRKKPQTMDYDQLTSQESNQETQKNSKNLLEIANTFLNSPLMKQIANTPSSQNVYDTNLSYSKVGDQQNNSSIDQFRLSKGFKGNDSLSQDDSIFSQFNQKTQEEMRNLFAKEGLTVSKNNVDDDSFINIVQESQKPQLQEKNESSSEEQKQEEEVQDEEYQEQQEQKDGNEVQEQNKQTLPKQQSKYEIDSTENNTKETLTNTENNKHVSFNDLPNSSPLTTDNNKADSKKVTQE